MKQSSLGQRVSDILLPRVQAPAQYIGGEVNQVRKDPAHIDTAVALAFPDTYAVGMSHLGTAILYAALNALDGVAAERVLCPWVDAVGVMRSEAIELFSWESRRPMRDFDILGITLQHELTYTNVLLLLDLAGITWRASARHEDEPLVIGGGPIADSCEPVAPFFDLIVLGDGEEALPAVVQAYRQLRGRLRRRELLLELARRFAFVYAPQFYACSYDADGCLTECEPTEAAVPRCVQRAMVADLDAAVFPTAPIVPHTEAVHDRIAIEVMRGCPGRCAFCHAGHTKGKLRWRSVETICRIAAASYRATGHDTVSLLSLSTSDYPELAELTRRLHAQFEGCHVGISLPSLRVDKQLQAVPEQVADVRREGLTLAVEAARDRLRRALGKRVTDGDLMATLTAAYQAGWRKVKLYFMAGFPGETEADLDGIVDLAAAISRARQDIRGAPAAVNAAVSWLVPKPHTPLQFAAQQDADYFAAVQERLIARKRDLKGVSLKLKFHQRERSLLEGVFARGDRRLAAVLETAYRAGAVFDAWDEHFRPELYEAALAAHGLEAAFYARRERPVDERLPWDHLAGDSHAALYHRWERIRALLAESEDDTAEPSGS